jgi:general stress protein 26
MEETNFDKIFESFLTHKDLLKVISVASSDKKGKPNSAPKMLIDIVKPNRVYFLDFKFTQTYANIEANPYASVSFMNDDEFRGYRVNGRCRHLESGEEFEMIKGLWEKRLIRYEADRIIRRVTGGYSAKEAENLLPKDFVISRLTADQGSIVKPDRVLRAVFKK